MDEFVGSMSSMSLYPMITKPSRILCHSETSMDNILINNVKQVVSGQWPFTSVHILWTWLQMEKGWKGYKIQDDEELKNL